MTDDAPALGSLSGIVEFVSVQAADHEDIQVRRGAASLARVPGGPRAEQVGLLDPPDALEFLGQHLAWPERPTRSQHHHQAATART